MTTVRRDELGAMTQPALCALYRKLGYIGGMHPPETWRKDEIIDSILSIESRQPAAGCEVCRRPGAWCGPGAVVTSELPCVGCGMPTHVRSRCGAARTAQCTGTAPGPIPPPVPARKPAPARTSRVSRTVGRKTAQRDATDAAMAGLATGEPLHLLADLEGPFAPLRSTGQGRMAQPYWRPPLPGITYAVHVVDGYAWRRPYVGLASVLDRSGAWIAAASSVLVAHGALEHTGECEFEGRPGYYQVTAYPWLESDVMPSPLGHLTSGTPWVPAPTVQLLRDLVMQGRWPDVAVLDSYTGDGVRLSEWTGHCNAIRGHAISTYGRKSPQYAATKENFGMAMSLMLGTVEDGVRRIWKCKAARPDITHTVKGQASSTLWRWGDDLRQIAPDMAPVALRNIDELVVPSDVLEILTCTERPGGRKPLVLDPTGIQLGSFKLKDIEEWT